MSSVSFGGNHPLEEDGTRHPEVASVEPRMILVPEGRDSLLAGNGNVPDAGESVTIGVDMIKRTIDKRAGERLGRRPQVMGKVSFNYTYMHFRNREFKLEEGRIPMPLVSNVAVNKFLTQCVKGKHQ